MTGHIKNTLKKTAFAMLKVCIELPCIVGLLIYYKLVTWLER